jgi:hypothetical protein
MCSHFTIKCIETKQCSLICGLLYRQIFSSFLMGNFLFNFKWEFVILHVILSVPKAVYNVIDFSVDIKALTISSYGEPGSSDSIVSYSVWLRAGRPGDRGSIPGRRERIFPLASVSRPALRPTQPPVQWVAGVLYRGLKRGRGVTLITHPLLVPRSRMSRSYISSPPSAFAACSGTGSTFYQFTYERSMSRMLKAKWQY